MWIKTIFYVIFASIGVFCIGFLLYCIISNGNAEYNTVLEEDRQSREKCRLEYESNKCDIIKQYGEIAKTCNEWKICMESKVHRTKSEFYAKALGKCVEWTLGSISFPVLIVLISAVFIYKYMF